jgi:hypothetical protein
VPAAAVIPAPIAYIKVVAVKKLVVELLAVPSLGPGRARGGHPSANHSRPSLARLGEQALYFEKIRVFQAGNRPDTLAWNNGIGLRSVFVGLGTGVMINRDSWGR